MVCFGYLPIVSVGPNELIFWVIKGNHGQIVGLFDRGWWHQLVVIILVELDTHHSQHFFRIQGIFNFHPIVSLQKLVFIAVEIFNIKFGTFNIYFVFTTNFVNILEYFLLSLFCDYWVLLLSCRIYALIIIRWPVNLIQVKHIDTTSIDIFTLAKASEQRLLPDLMQAEDSLVLFRFLFVRIIPFIGPSTRGIQTIHRIELIEIFLFGSRVWMCLNREQILACLSV